MNALGFRRRGNLDSQRWIAGRHINEDRAGLSSSERAVLAEDHFADIARVTDDGEDDIRVPRNFSRRVGPLRALGEEALGFGLGPAVGGNLVAFGEQMSGHALAHHARADPTEFCFVRGNCGDGHRKLSKFEVECGKNKCRRQTPGGIDVWNIAKEFNSLENYYEALTGISACVVDEATGAGFET